MANSNHTTPSRDAFLVQLQSEWCGDHALTKRSLEKLAASYGITDQTEVKELAEFSIVQAARQIALSGHPHKDNYWRIVDLYRRQANLSHRTSNSMLLQQYSTPAPISYLAGLFVNADRAVSVFEPSAGNGLLTVAADPARVVVNEIDAIRRDNLKRQGYREVLNQDGQLPFAHFRKRFDAILTNPPFGVLDEHVLYEGFAIEKLEYVMALRGLDCMKDNGKAALVVGGHTRWDKKGRIQAGPHRVFFNYLYSRYSVMDMINIDGHALYSRQGTSIDVRLILIAGRKMTPSGAAPIRESRISVVVKTFEELFDRVTMNIQPRPESSEDVLAMEAEALLLELELLNPEDLGIVYTPASRSAVLNTVVPDSMGYETHSALQRIQQAVGGNIDEYVRTRLRYRTLAELYKALSAEQIDAVGMAIYNIETRGQGMIIGDQTGIGKGRTAAAVIRYGVTQGIKPIFLTEKANLFSDLYRDLAAIGSAHLVPFIVNARDGKTDIKDEEGQVMYQAPPSSVQQHIFEQRHIPDTYHFVMATYSQFNSEETKPTKPAFLKSIAQDTIVVMDEAHNASGAGNTGTLMQAVLGFTRGVVFLSATFAKRPDNMPLYGTSTAIGEANMSKIALVDAIKKGGVALQEIISSQLVNEGQMIRRERSFEGVEVNYITLEEKEQEHRAISDMITAIIRDIIDFQKRYINPMVDELDDQLLLQGKQAGIREGTSEAGIDNQPYVSKVFNVINQMLFSIKAESVADRAIARLKEGKKPVIAFSSTMGSFVSELAETHGLGIGGEPIPVDFSTVLQRGLDGIFRYTVTGEDGKRTYESFDIAEFPPEARVNYDGIQKRIREASTGITISPIDIIIEKIEAAGYSVAEVTGRQYKVLFEKSTSSRSQAYGVIETRKRENTNDAFRKFNNNQVDVLLINQSGSTGASAHAIVTSQVSRDHVKQRVMIVLQPELDISIEVQKRGRINRTGQLFKPIYDYVNSAIPAEKRLMMMLQKKLKSLDANTTSNQKSSTKILDVPDFLNKYGDRVVAQYLGENAKLNAVLGNPLDLESGSLENAANRIAGRVAILSTGMQHDFYADITTRYNEQVEYLKQTGEYDLEVEAMDLQAETMSSRVIIVGTGGESEFGEDSILETVMANVLRKPFSADELNKLLGEPITREKAERQHQELVTEHDTFSLAEQETDIHNERAHIEALIKNIPNEKRIKRQDPEAARDAIEKRNQEMREALEASIAKIQQDAEKQRRWFSSVASFFYVGRSIYFPFTNYNGKKELIAAVFVGFTIDRKRKNPFAPSAIKLRLAIASSLRYVVLPLSYSTEVYAIQGASAGLVSPERTELLNNWEASIKSSTADRRIRHIITGNVLQAFGEYGGKLISYTSKDGEIKKGILLNEYYEEEEPKDQQIVVPVLAALKIIQSLGSGTGIMTRSLVSFSRQGDRFKLYVPAARSAGGEVYLDEDFLALVEDHNFKKVSNKMTAILAADKLEAFVKLLQQKVSDSVSLSLSQYNIIGNQNNRRTKRQSPVVTVPSPDNDEVEILEMEAQALELELELLNFKAA